ncbi:MAG: 2-C-methyl-D-erythritol 2,4-cyclodiphosphate synthase [Planctomycetota bacterium]
MYGLGIDFHRIEKGRALLLGGVTITKKFGAIGDSDADVVLHSLSDAILSALKKGDIGTYFHKEKKYTSSDITKILIQKFLKNKYKVIALNVIIFLEKPQLLNKKELIKKSLAKLLEIDTTNINIQAKTFQGLFEHIVLAISFIVLEEI